MKLQHNDIHFLYCKYAAPRYRAPLWRRVRKTLRDSAKMHDIWAWTFVVFVLAVFLLLEWMR